MPSLSEFKNRIKNAGEIKSIVKTMKTIAAVNMRQYEKMQISVKEYAENTKKGLDLVFVSKEQEIPSGTTGIIVIGSDMGICGRFNEQLAQFIGDQTKGNKLHVMTVGDRITQWLESSGLRTELIFQYPRSLILDVIPVINDLVLEIDNWQKKEIIDRVLIFYNKPVSSASYEPYSFQLYPFEPPAAAEPRNSYFHYLDKKELFEGISVQYMFALIYRSFIESLISENASRLIAMQVAEKNINEQLELLTAEFNNERQNSVTSEILDVIAGFETLVNTK